MDMDRLDLRAGPADLPATYERPTITAAMSLAATAATPEVR